jgi:hypothetical protein
VKLRHWLIFIVVLAAVSAKPSLAAPVDATQIVAWLTGGISNARLARIVNNQGLAYTLTPEQLRQVESAGADQNLIHILAAQKQPATAPTAQTIPTAVLKASAAARNQQWHEAELLLRPAVLSDPENAALHFALSAMLRQQEQ